MLVLEEREGRLVAEWEADTPIDEPLVFDEAQTYTGDPTPLTAARTYQWIHSLPRIVGALTGAGLVLEFVHEHTWLPWPPFPMCIDNGDGTYCLPQSAPPLPLAVSLRAVDRKVGLIGAVRRDGQQHEVIVCRRGERVSNRQGCDDRIARGNVEGQAVGQDAAGVHERHRVVLQGVRVELTRNDPIRLEEQAGQRELDRVFEEAALRLEVMLRQVHAFVPHDVR